eukprot:417923-Pelagomonas_calceolata.AAC.1
MFVINVNVMKTNDELHALFYSNCFEVCELRRNYKDLFIDLFKPLHTFARLMLTCEQSRLLLRLPFLKHYHASMTVDAEN